ncbi:Oidioi.mRNA.OKI2018_I69.chr1.g3226.t1.cds [Oikopleura dioica]|uniref:Oidioi.mRNA.OKI2018_I69.chr1.g3226.t1.cds n=1 Tax=Oikopleura dioica TaxID=34765 RepID=A0ABN7STH1_OIKDI|nr:Oidioi.mRNA.OKI2018_I69.chr1.g3226.t1.cds [Oikopleura dioica]
MTVGVPFSRQFRKIITSDLYGIGDLSDRKFSHQEIATMQTGTVVSFHERGSELRRGTFLVSSVSVLRRISPGQLIGELLSNQELTHFCQIKNLSTKTYATSVIEAYEFVKKVGENTRIMQKISMNKNIVPANKRALPREPVQVINVDPGMVRGFSLNPQMKKQKSAEESFTRDFPKGKPSTENKEENYIDDDDDKPVIDSFHVSNSNKVHTVEDSDDDTGDVKVELIEEDDEEIEEIRSEPPPPIAIPQKLDTEAQANTALQIQRLLEYQKQMQTLKLSPQIRRTGEVVNSGVRKYNSPGTIRDISFNQGNPSKYGRITVM